ncbi:cytochrome c oxidase assembly protein [Prosthecomicrobium sp. N25]|uniref:cytochrome c oxidase assembly protein n=1 Tax=Prosthecomicrobium sp. N25 TaxID=3129254 RepID=UPI00307779D2
MADPTPTAYCGTPPLPGAVSWNLDPVLIFVLALAAGLHLRALRGAGPARTSLAAAGWAILAVSVISPLCNLSVALFSARATQHMLLTLVAAPLVAAGLAGLPSLPRFLRDGLWTATAAFAAVLWAWHLPAPYEATFTSATLYWAMQASLFATAVWLWTALLARPAGRFGHSLAVGFATALQMSGLGALLTFAARPWYAVHAVTTVPWGLSPLEDQQLGGLVMWIPAGVVITALAIAEIGRELSQLERRGGEIRP